MLCAPPPQKKKVEEIPSTRNQKKEIREETSHVRHQGWNQAKHSFCYSDAPVNECIS